MTSCAPRWLLAGLGAAVLAHAAGEDPGFMPKGGRTLLLEWLGGDAKELRLVVSAKRSDAQWLEFVAAKQPQRSERERATLAAYLAVNAPLPDAATRGAVALPPDGRDLAWEQCQFCHSLFTSHLTQRRDVQGWRSIFLSPFHRQMKMDERQREEFARYSAINMPMADSDVPSELRY
jgi:hypothetical protein